VALYNSRRWTERTAPRAHKGLSPPELEDKGGSLGVPGEPVRPRRTATSDVSRSFVVGWV
jgi:hypothetical protein